MHSPPISGKKIGESSSSSSSSTSSSSSPNNANSSRYKTELCRPFEESGVCKYGDKCQFAHGLNELRNLQRHPKYKTELCRTFHTIGLCPYGPRCHFIHMSEESKKIVMNTLQVGSGGSGGNSPSCNSNNNPNSGNTTTLTTSNGSCNKINSNHHHLHGNKLMASKGVQAIPTAPWASQMNGNDVMSDSIALINGLAQGRASSGSNGGHPRPKAFSIGSTYSDTSQEFSSPSIPSGSPTSLNSFLVDDPFGPIPLLTTNHSKGEESQMNGILATKYMIQPNII